MYVYLLTLAHLRMPCAYTYPRCVCVRVSDMVTCPYPYTYPRYVLGFPHSDYGPDNEAQFRQVYVQSVARVHTP